MKTLGYYNGEIGEIDEIKIPMNDRVHWFGDGVYDATLCANYVIFALDDHIDRFFSSASLINIKLPLSKEEMKDVLRSLVKRLETPEQFVYWQVTRGTAGRTHAFPENAKPNIWVMLRPIVLPDQERKLKLITVDDTRFLHCNIKTLNLLPNVLASEKARAGGCDEAVFHRGDRVTECTRSNVHILKNGVFRTAPLDEYILPGITRAHLIGRCRALKIPVEEKAFSLDEMMDADEVIVTSTSTFCASASHIDGKPVGGRAEDTLKVMRNSMIEEFKKKTAPKQ